MRLPVHADDTLSIWSGETKGVGLKEPLASPVLPGMRAETVPSSGAAIQTVKLGFGSGSPGLVGKGMCCRPFACADIWPLGAAALASVQKTVVFRTYTIAQPEDHLEWDAVVAIKLR